MKTDVTTLEAKKAGTVDLSDDVFGLEPRTDILHRMVRYQLAKRRAGTVSVKDRSQITGSTVKIMNQKGSGRARHSTRKANLFRGGGKSFGPKPRDHSISLPKKVRALALRHALSSKVKSKELIILENIALKDTKTGGLKKKLAKLGWASALIVDGAELEKNFSLAARNIIGIDVLAVQGINVYDILRRDKLVLTKAAVEALEARFK
jgi:large subunit ribosomal protein L4